MGELLQDVHQRRALLSDMNSVSAIVALLSSPNLATQHNAAVRDARERLREHAQLVGKGAVLAFEVRDVAAVLLD